MRSSGSACLPSGHKYCHKRGMAVADHPGLACQGSNMAMMPPFPRSLEHAVMQGKVRGVHDSRPLGGRDGLVWLGSKARQIRHGFMVVYRSGRLSPAVPRGTNRQKRENVRERNAGSAVLGLKIDPASPLAEAVRNVRA
jgi:hypothetical protein